MMKIPVVSLFGSRLAVAGVTALALSIFWGNALAQSGTRPYPMSILAATQGVSGASSDLPIFTRNAFSNYQDQPPERSIAWLPPSANLGQHNIDWAKIVAVYVDEPYGEILKNRNSCAGTPSPIAQMMSTLEAMATELRARAPRARFWVNFTKHEIDLILNPDAGCPLNQPYIDVISMDVYGVHFHPMLTDLYNDLYEHRATSSQQLALVPGTFTQGWENQSGAQGAARLSGYFAYATVMNQQCDLPLGSKGLTGFYDGCPVWMIAGWTGGITPLDEQGYFYYPIDNPSSQLVFNAWQTQFAIPRADPSRSRLMRALIPLFSE
jgi:hypothetical protein